MPPKAKFTKEHILSVALEFVRERGIEPLTARSLADALGSSPRPIFTVFDSMEEVQSEVVSAARELYGEYVARGLECTPRFKGVGEQYIRFATEEPKLFMLLFMRERAEVSDIASALELIDDNSREILKSIVDGYGVDEELAKRLYAHMWLYAHGIATLIATGVCSFSHERISEMLTDVFSGLLIKYNIIDRSEK